MQLCGMIPTGHACNTDTHLQDKPVVDMESEFLNLGLEIIGLGVFNYDFGAINKESPVIKVC